MNMKIEPEGSATLYKLRGKDLYTWSAKWHPGSFEYRCYDEVGGRSECDGDCFFMNGEVYGVGDVQSMVENALAYRETEGWSRELPKTRLELLNDAVAHTSRNPIMAGTVFASNSNPIVTEREGRVERVEFGRFNNIVITKDGVLSIDVENIDLTRPMSIHLTPAQQKVVTKTCLMVANICKICWTEKGNRTA